MGKALLLSSESQGPILKVRNFCENRACKIGCSRSIIRRLKTDSLALKQAFVLCDAAAGRLTYIVGIGSFY